MKKIKKSLHQRTFLNFILAQWKIIYILYMKKIEESF